MKKIAIFDTTLRDGEQSPGCSMYLEEKISMARQLEKLGVDVIEAGFPFASEGDFLSVQTVARECRNSTIAGLCRTVPKDIYRAAEALKDAHKSRIHIFLATSDIHLEYKLQKSRDEILEMAASAIRIAGEFTEDIEFSAEDATRSDVDFLCQVLSVAVDAGARVLN
jgi:2-isopropylmalate synthase